jgi:predicted RNA binding protein YcfA (HicA-like mRNA interferase family)
MKLPRDLSGRRLVGILCRRWGYREAHRVGSHVVLVCEHPLHQRIAVPDHDRLRVGTLAGIVRAVARVQGVSPVDILAEE